MVFWPAERPLEPTRTGIVNVSVAPELSVPIVKVIDPLATARLAVALAVPLLKLTVGREVKPLPPFVTMIPVTTPPEIVAVAVAPVPPPPEMVTVGATAYPLPPELTAIEATEFL